MSWLGRIFGRGKRAVAAKYDAAQTTSQNRNHWSLADSLSAGSANSPAVRKTLRERARYEVANNGYLRGIARTLANDCVGIGPRLQVRTTNQTLNAEVEKRWAKWAEAVGLAQKLRTMRAARMVDGEAFGLLITNRRVPGPVKLDLSLLEADQVENPSPMPGSDLANGIRLDSAGNPRAYFVLRTHPGEQGLPFSPFDYEEVDAEFVLHYFDPVRAGDIRGVPEITSTLSLGADGRRYRSAVVGAAETAANMALVLQTDGAAETAAAATPYDLVAFVRNQATVLPDGWKLGQAKPEQPTTTHAEFVRSQITETARPLCMPFNVAAGDSSSYNYASGRLDHQAYFKATAVEQDLLRTTVLERVFGFWLRLAALQSDELASQLAKFPEVEHQWLWPGNEHVDPQKEANAQETRLRTGATTLTRELAREGIDVEVHSRERLQEAMAQLERTAALLKRAKELGVPESVAIALAVPQQSAPAAAEPEQDEDEGPARPAVVRRDRERANAAA